MSETFEGDPLGLQPADADPVFRSIAEYNHRVRSVLFGHETPEQRQLRIEMFGEDLSSGLMETIKEKRVLIDKLKRFTPEQYAKLTQGRTMREAEAIVRERLEREKQGLGGLNGKKLDLVRRYNPVMRRAMRSFAPPNQTGYTCVPTSLHEVGTRVIGAHWPFKSAIQTQQEFDSFTHGDWTNPSRIGEFIRHLNQKGVPVGARGCIEPLTLTAGLHAGGMAVAKHQDWAHAYILEDFENDGKDLEFVVGNTLGGTVRKRVGLVEVDQSFFKPDEINAVTVVVPLTAKVAR